MSIIQWDAFIRHAQIAELDNTEKKALYSGNTGNIQGLVAHISAIRDSLIYNTDMNENAVAEKLLEMNYGEKDLNVDSSDFKIAGNQTEEDKNE